MSVIQRLYSQEEGDISLSQLVSIHHENDMTIMDEKGGWIDRISSFTLSSLYLMSYSM